MLVVTAALLWSTLGLGVRLMDEAGPWRILFYRAVAQVLVLGVLIAARNPGAFTRTLTGIGHNGLLSAAFLSFSSISFVYALTLTTVAEATMILGATPVMAGLLGWMLLREPITRTNWWTMGIAAAGLGVVAYTGTVSGNVVGIILAACGALGFAAFSVFQRRGRQSNMLPAVLLSGVVTMLVTGPLVGGATISGSDILVAFYLGGVALTGGLALYTAGSRHVRAGELVLISMTEVVFAPLWVWWAFGETMVATTIVGGIMIMAAVMIQARAPEAIPALLRHRRARRPN